MKPGKNDIPCNQGLNADQVFLSMAMMDQLWYNVPVIYLKRGNDSLRSIAGVEKGAKYAALGDFFDAQGNYKLTHLLERLTSRKCLTSLKRTLWT